MSQVTKKAKRLGCAIAVALLVSASAHATEWDQVKVTTIAGELGDAVNEVHKAISRNRSAGTVGSGQASDFMLLRDRVRVARNESRHLAASLRDGKGRDETVHAYDRLMTLVRDAREVGRRMMIGQDVQSRVQVASEKLDELAPYYAKTGSGAETE